MITQWAAVHRRHWLAIALALLPGAAPAQELGETVIQSGRVEEDTYLAGGRVQVLADVTGDVVAAGGRVTIAGKATGDVMAAGGDVVVSGPVGDDVRALGGTVTVSGPVGDDAVAAGGRVILDPRSRVGGRAWLAGGEVTVAGQVGRQLKAAAGSIVISGTVKGDAELAGGDIHILPTARIDGNLTYRSPARAVIEPGATIAGKTVYQPMQPPPRPGYPRVSALWLLTLLVTGAVLVLLFPRFSVDAARTVGRAPWQSLGLGVLVLLTTPAVVFALMVTVIGLPLAFICATALLAAVLAGYLIGALFLGATGSRWLGRSLESSRAWRLFALTLALVVLALVGAIPILGTLALILVLLFGLGALVTQLYQAYQR